MSLFHHRLRRSLDLSRLDDYPCYRSSGKVRHSRPLRHFRDEWVSCDILCPVSESPIFQLIPALFSCLTQL